MGEAALGDWGLAWKAVGDGEEFNLGGHRALRCFGLTLCFPVCTVMHVTHTKVNTETHMSTQKNTQDKDPALSLRIPQEMMDALQKKAKKEERPVSWVVRKALQEWLDKNADN